MKILLMVLAILAVISAEAKVSTDANVRISKQQICNYLYMDKDFHSVESMKVIIEGGVLSESFDMYVDKCIKEIDEGLAQDTANDMFGAKIPLNLMNKSSLLNIIKNDNATQLKKQR